MWSLTDAEFALASREIAQRSGLSLTPEMAGMVTARLMPILLRAGFTTPGDFFAAAKEQPSFWDKLTEALADPQTRFFRDRALFARLRSSIAPQLLAARGDETPLRMLSAGCASGQEAYSLALVLEELRDGGAAGGSVLGLDLHEGLIERAREGAYSHFEAQRGMPIRTLIRAFEKSAHVWRVGERLRGQARFERGNLLSDLSGLGRFDVIFCCHVTEAMTAQAARQTLSHLASLLTEGGFLALSPGAGAQAAALGLSASEDGFFQSAAGGARAAA